MTQTTTANTIRRILMFLAGALVIGLAAAARADSIRLHEQAGVRSAEVTLGQIAELEGADAEALGDTVIATLAGERATVSLEAVRRRLEEHGVNWADVSLCGYSICRVSRLSSDPPLQTDSDAAVVSNPRDEVTLASSMTLRDLLVARLEQVARGPAAQLRIAFDPRDAAQLGRSVFGQRFEVEPHKSAGLGRVLLRVRRYELEEVVEQFTITADVQRRALAVVAVDTINRGQTFIAGAFEVREVYLDDESVEPIADPKLLIGRVSCRLLRAGAIITPEDVRSAVMVKRGELVSVRCISGNLVVRLEARAAEDGAMGETIRLRNERSRENFTATVTGRREATFNAHNDPDSESSTRRASAS